jgi:hypothetical protein
MDALGRKRPPNARCRCCLDGCRERETAAKLRLETLASSGRGLGSGSTRDSPQTSASFLPKGEDVPGRPAATRRVHIA